MDRMLSSFPFDSLSVFGYLPPAILGGVFIAQRPKLRVGDGDGVLEAFVPVVLPASKVCDINVPEDLDLARTLLLGARAEVAAR